MLANIATDQAPLFVAIIAAVSAFVAAFVNVIATAIQNWLARRHAAQQQLRDLAVKLAIEKWKYEAPLRDKLREDVHTAFIKTSPYDPLPKIPGASLTDAFREMVKLIESVTV